MKTRLLEKDTLTDSLVRSIKVGSKQFEIFDSKISGFGIRVSPGGTKSWTLLHRFEERDYRLTIGTYPSLTLAHARRLAQDALGQVARGINPQAEKRRARKNFTTNVFQNFAQDFIENHAKRNTRSWGETERIPPK